jgi:hypothetical protein
MKNEIRKYTDNDLIVFSVNVKQIKHENGTWKKNLH